MARNPHASYEASDHQRMPIIPKFTDYIANNLTTTVAGFALDARQGKILNETKLNIANVVNNLTTTVAGYALDARQGKALDDKITSLNNSLYVNKGNVFIWNDHRGSDVKNIKITFPFVAYRSISGFVYTRYGICAFNFAYGAVSGSGAATVTTIIGSETYTASVSGDVFTITSNIGWNSFLVVGFCNHTPSTISATTF